MHGAETSELAAESETYPDGDEVDIAKPAANFTSETACLQTVPRFVPFLKLNRVVPDHSVDEERGYPLAIYEPVKLVGFR